MAEYQGGPQAVDPDVLKIALMTQDMSSFGVASAGTSTKERENVLAPLDYFGG